MAGGLIFKVCGHQEAWNVVCENRVWKPIMLNQIHGYGVPSMGGLPQS